jgi:hypothetical protein
MTQRLRRRREEELTCEGATQETRIMSLRVDRTGRYSNRPGQPALLDLLIRCQRELNQLAALVRQVDGLRGL